MLIPADIDNKQFATTRLKEGYDQQDVDDFLDRVGEDFQFYYQQALKLEQENAQLRKQLDLARNESPTASIPAVAQTPSAVAERLLAAAETAAKEHEADALREADKVIREAGGQGARIIEEAKEAAERIKSEGLAEKYRRSEELERKIEKSEKLINSLDLKGNQVRRALADMINSYDSEFPT